MAEVNNSRYPLHECVFKGDLRKLSALLRTEDVERKDVHGKYTIVFTIFELC